MQLNLMISSYWSSHAGKGNPSCQKKKKKNYSGKREHEIINMKSSTWRKIKQINNISISLALVNSNGPELDLLSEKILLRAGVSKKKWHGFSSQESYNKDSTEIKYSQLNIY